MVGFLTGPEMSYDQEDLYNSVNSSGNILWAPLENGLSAYDENDAVNTWMLIHEFGHALQEGTHSLYAKGGLTRDTDEYLHSLAKCLHCVAPDKVTKEMKDVLESVQVQLKEGQIEIVGA